jgi:hypothetical protein
MGFSYKFSFHVQILHIAFSVDASCKNI